MHYAYVNTETQSFNIALTPDAIALNILLNLQSPHIFRQKIVCQLCTTY